jgi:hypothetical protein
VFSHDLNHPHHLAYLSDDVTCRAAIGLLSKSPAVGRAKAREGISMLRINANLMLTDLRVARGERLT